MVCFRENQNGYFQNVAYIVEFVIFSDFYGSAPYYGNVGYLESVAVYTDGTMEACKTNPLKEFRGKTYSTDYSEFLDSVVEYADAYNVQKILK